MIARSPWSRNATVALAVAVGWSLLLVVGAFVLPVYSTSTGSATSEAGSGAGSTPTVVEGTATMVGVNGPGVLLVVGLPLVLSVLVAWALAARRRRIGWVITGGQCFLNVVALMSIGLFFTPVTLALVVACASTERRHVVRRSDDPAGATSPA